MGGRQTWEHSVRSAPAEFKGRTLIIFRALVLKEIVPSTPPESPSSSRSSSPVLPFGSRPAHVLAMASMLGHLFTLDSNKSLKMINMSTVDGVPVPNTLVRELPAHHDPCLGVRLLPLNCFSDALFFTWSSGGTVLFWNLDGVTRGEFQVELEQPMESEDDVANELKVVRVSEDGGMFVTGDKYGVLRYFTRPRIFSWDPGLTFRLV